MTIWMGVGGVFAVLTLLEAWCLWRVRAALDALPRLEERVARLAATMELLTDTTEACFRAIGTQLGPEAGRATSTATERRARQRRVVGASRRGRTVKEIAAMEEISESEAALRLHLADDPLARAGHADASLRA